MHQQTFETHEEWLTARRADFGIGASTVGAIVGASTYRSAWDVWSSHFAPEAQKPGNIAQLQRGHHLERHILRLYAEQHDVDVTHFDRTICYHTDHTWARFSPDGIRSDGGIVEVKTARGGWPWRDAPEVIDSADMLSYLPTLSYGLQAYWQMLISGAAFVDLVVLPLGHELASVADALAMQYPDALEAVAEAIRSSLVVVRIMRDPVFIKRLGDRIAAWRQTHLIEGKEPPAEGPAASAHHGKVPKRGEVNITDIDHPVVQLADALHHAKAVKKDADAKVKTYTGRLKQAMQHVESVTCDRGTIAWRKAGRGKAIDLRQWMHGGTTECDLQPDIMHPSPMPTEADDA